MEVLVDISNMGLIYLPLWYITIISNMGVEMVTNNKRWSVIMHDLYCAVESHRSHL